MVLMTCGDESPPLDDHDPCKAVAVVRALEEYGYELLRDASGAVVVLRLLEEYGYELL